MATMLMPDLRRDFSGGCNSSSITTKSPSTTALSSAPAKAAQVLTPISFPTSQPQGIFTVRPKTALNMPSLVSPLVPKTVWIACAVIELLPGLRVLGADFLHGIEDGANSFREHCSVAFPADVHEVNLGFIEEEMIVQGGHLQTGVERRAHN